MKLSLISEFIQNLRIERCDNSDDRWADADAIARQSGLYITRSKELTFLATDDQENVVGAIWSSIAPDEDHRLVYDFDVAVDERSRNPVDKVGLRLIEAAIRDFHNHKADLGEEMYMQVYVVNRRLARVLERRYGFTPIEEHGHGPISMVYGVG